MNNTALRIVVAGFLAGAISVLVFHQVGFWLATQLKFANSTFYNMRGVPPWGVPTIVSQAFWGGLWGIAAAFIVPRLPGVLRGILGWVLFAAVVVTLANWFIVLPIKGSPVGGGWRMPGPVVVPIVYAFWGLGMWAIYNLVRRTMKWA